VVNVVEDKVALVDLEDLEDREVSVVVVSKVDLVEVVRTAVERLVNPSLAVLSKEDLDKAVLVRVVKADLEVNEAVVKVASVVKAVLVWILKWDGSWMSLSKRFSTRHSTRGSSKLNFRFLVRWESLDPISLRRLV
jgi:hypothetical protein